MRVPRSFYSIFDLSPKVVQMQGRVIVDISVPKCLVVVSIITADFSEKFRAQLFILNQEKMFALDLSNTFEAGYFAGCVGASFKECFFYNPLRRYGITNDISVADSLSVSVSQDPDYLLRGRFERPVHLASAA